MKKKICCIAAEMFLAMALISACADGRQKAVGNMENVSKSREDAGCAAQASSDFTAEEAQESKDAVDIDAAPDLNHNGRAGEVRLIDLADGQGQLLEIWEGD